MNLTIKQFIEVYGDGGNIRKFKSPARINIIGEHTDYNGGYVFPCALDFGTYAIARKREDNIIKLNSLLFDEVVLVSIDELEYKEEHNWANYAKGVVDEFLKAGYKLGGFEILINSDMPLSSGLSSSASLEILISKVLDSLFELNVSSQEMAILSQKAENNYMGLNCGIMDQFIIANGEQNMAMLLQCNTLKYEQIPLNLGEYKIVICNTKKPRKLIESKYNERLSECKKGLDLLKKYVNISCLCELSEDNFLKFKDKIEDETIRKRVEHAVYETVRTFEAKNAMVSGDLEKLGQCIIGSHNSLRDLYEVTGFELDTMVESALKQDGVLGARMVGAGFGGCAISLVHKDKIDSFIENVGDMYFKETSLKAEFYIANVGNGVEEL